MRAELITDVSQLPAVEDDWRALAEQRSNGFITPEWFRSWWDHRGSSSSPLICVVRRDDGAVAGVMPLVVDSSRRPRVIRFGGASLGDRFHPVAAEADEYEVASASMAAIEAEGLGQNLVLLEHVPRNRPWWQGMSKASSTRRATIAQQQTGLFYVPLEDLDWETFVSQRSAKFRSQIRRRERVLRRDHGLELHVATEQSLEADLADFFRLHELRWRGHGSALEVDTTKRILADFARSAQHRGWLRLHLLKVEGASVAAFFGWRLGGSYVSYQGGFDPAWANKSVGIVLTALTIRSAIEEGAAEFDFLLGTEAYKRSFTTESRPAQNLILAKATSPSRLLIEGEARVRRLGRGMIERPALNGFARSLRYLLPTARRN